MISKDKLFFLNQLVDSISSATEKLETDGKNKKEIINFILSIQSEIKELLMIIK